MIALVAALLAGCYASHPRSPDVVPPWDGGPDAPTCGPVLACGPIDDVPILHFRLDGDFTSSGSLPGHDGVATGTPIFVPGAIERGLGLPLGASLVFPGTSSVLATAPALTFSIHVRGLDGALRNFLGCRIDDRGFEAYFARRRVYACAGDPDGPPRAWGACANVPVACGLSSWAHVVLRWRGAGTEPELAVDGGPWALLHADGFPVDGRALFEGTLDLVVGVGSGDGSGSRGRLEVDDLRVYDVALPDERVWAVTGCPR